MLSEYQHWLTLARYYILRICNVVRQSRIVAVYGVCTHRSTHHSSQITHNDLRHDNKHCRVYQSAELFIELRRHDGSKVQRCEHHWQRGQTNSDSPRLAFRSVWLTPHWPPAVRPNCCGWNSTQWGGLVTDSTAILKSLVSSYNIKYVLFASKIWQLYKAVGIRTAPRML